jgi:hypothetical protein
MTTKEAILEIIGHRPLTEVETNLLENWRATDKNFDGAVDFQLQLSAAIHEQERTDLKNLLQQVEAEMVKPEAKRVRFQSFRWMAVAASVIMALGLWWVVGNREEDNLYAAHFRPYPNVIAPVTRNAAPGTDPLVQKAFQAYETGEYAEADALFNTIFLQSGEYYPRFYQALCKMGEGHTEAALQIWQSNEWPITPFDMKDAAAWYAALCLVQQNKTREALPRLEQIAGNETSLYAKEAEKIIARLKN